MGVALRENENELPPVTARSERTTLNVLENVAELRSRSISDGASKIIICTLYMLECTAVNYYLLSSHAGETDAVFRGIRLCV